MFLLVRILITLVIASSVGCGIKPDQEKKVIENGQFIASPGSTQNENESGENAKQDADMDGLSDQEEFTCGTDPELADTDEDGLSDYEECVEYLSCDPLSGDTDGDGVKDGDAIKAGNVCAVIVADKDGDGEKPPLDCDDNDPSVNSKAIDKAGDGIDLNCRPDIVSCSFEINPNENHPDLDEMEQLQAPGLWTLEAVISTDPLDGGKSWHENFVANLEVNITRDGLDGDPPSEVYETGWFAYEFDFIGAQNSPGWLWQNSGSTVHPECGPILKTGEGQTLSYDLAFDTLPAQTALCEFTDATFGGNENFVTVKRSGAEVEISAQLLRVYWNKNGSTSPYMSLADAQGFGTCAVGD